MANTRHHPDDGVLHVYLYERHVGTLGQNDDAVWFQYDEGIIETPSNARWAISVCLPVRGEPFGHRDTLAFFDNLLLEADLRDELAQITRRDRRDVAGLLGAVGGECSGAVSLWPHGITPPVVPKYRPYGGRDLEAVFTDRHGERSTVVQLESRQMLSGVQQKLVFRKDEAGYALPLRGAPSNVILKRPSSRYPGLVANEVFCERAMQALGLPIPASRAIPTLDLFESERYDRIAGADGTLVRLHQEDFCQVTGRPPRRKYQQDDGPTFRDCANVLRRYSVRAAEDIANFVTATIGNVCLGNMDAHAKNFALLTTSEGRRLAPLYDVVCTEVYPALATELSMFIGAARNPAAINRADIGRLANMMGVTPRLIFETIDRVTTRLEDELSNLLHQVSGETNGDPILDQIGVFVRARCKKLRQGVA